MRTLIKSCRALVEAYQTDNWWPSAGPFETMLGAVLVQNTRWTNAARALENLAAAGADNPETLLSVDGDRLLTLIRPAGCQRVKRRRVRSLAQLVVDSGGIEFLARHKTAALRTKLLAVNGIGPESADAILCFAFHRQVFIADGYTRRWLVRIDPNCGHSMGSYGTGQRWFTGRLGSTVMDYRRLHAAIVQHGQQVCGITPRCHSCVVSNNCIYYQEL